MPSATQLCRKDTEYWLAFADFVSAEALWPAILEPTVLKGKALYLAGRQCPCGKAA